MRFQLIDRISDPGAPHKANDDQSGFSEGIAVVADGATGLHDKRLLPDGPSDAWWVANELVEGILAKSSDEPIREIVAGVCAIVRKAVFSADDETPIPRYAWPTSGFIAARHQGALIEITGLGDCSAFLKMHSGHVERLSALPVARGQEINKAATDLDALDDLEERTSALENERVLASLRQARENINTPESNIWTIGPVIEASEHVMSIAMPTEGVSEVLLASDGFSALVDDYGRYDDAGLLAAISEKGLEALVAEIRRIERMEDPEMTRFPRYKQSDDSTAILLKITN